VVKLVDMVELVVEDGIDDGPGTTLGARVLVLTESGSTINPSILRISSIIP